MGFYAPLRDLLAPDGAIRVFHSEMPYDPVRTVIGLTRAERQRIAILTARNFNALEASYRPIFEAVV